MNKTRNANPQIDAIETLVNREVIKAQYGTVGELTEKLTDSIYEYIEANYVLKEQN